MLAPPITKENAADYARRATIARELNRAQGPKAYKPFPASREAFAQTRAKKQVDKVLRWMEKEKSKDEYAKLAATLDRLWSMAYPKQGNAKPRSSNRRSAPSVTQTPQETTVIAATNPPSTPPVT